LYPSAFFGSALPSLFFAVVFLNDQGCVVLLFSVAFNGLVFEASPELVEFFLVFGQVVWVVNDSDILLIVGASLESPVERSSDEEIVVDNGKFVVHVVRGLRISPAWDSGVC